PDFSEGPSIFPPVKSVPHHYASVVDGIWFSSKGNPVTRRFVFDADSISKLKSKARSETLGHPTTADALSGFIWKSTISAYASYSNNNNYYDPSLLCHTVNLRKPTRSRLSRHSFGNMVLFTASRYDPKIDGLPRIADLAILVRNEVSKINNKYVGTMYERHGSQHYEIHVRSLEDFEDEKLNVVEVSCWHGFGLIKTDFGWGPAVWVGLSGRGATGKEDEDDGNNKFIQNQVLIENSKGGIEAWLTLEESLMKALEKDPDFLEFASAKSNIVP
ncbi:Deacetylvindoline O-acetyltransferase, partial [Linum perenne]